MLEPEENEGRKIVVGKSKHYLALPLQINEHNNLENIKLSELKNTNQKENKVIFAPPVGTKYNFSALLQTQIPHQNAFIGLKIVDFE